MAETTIVTEDLETVDTSSNSKFGSKDIILTKKLHNVLYELMVKTRANMVYVDNYDVETLTERLASIAEDLLSLNERSDTFDNKFADLLKDAPETFRTFKEVWDYVNVNGDPESELIRMIKSKQDAEEGKGLSTHDLTDVLYEKLVNGYSKEELNSKFDIILENEAGIVQNLTVVSENLETFKNETTSKFESVENRIEEVDKKPNAIVSETIPADLPDLSCWYHVISEDSEEE